MDAPLSTHAANDSRLRRLWPWVLLLFFTLLVARLLAVYNLYFVEEDEISLAAGIAALVRDNAGDLYRYTPQWGYHRFIEWVTLALGGDVGRIPSIMKMWSALVGALVPALGLLMFRDRLSTRERWLLALVLAVNPILWHSSQYGNSAIASLGFVVLGMVPLSNPGGVRARAMGLACLGIAIFVRADAILALPMFVWLVRLQTGSWRRTVAPIALLGVAGLGGAVAIFLLDPRLDSAASALMRHMFAMDNRTQFWEYLVWAFSPLTLGLAVLGLRATGENRRRLFGAIAIGALVPCLFYFRATTTPRYFLLAVVPLSIAAAVGIEDLARMLQARLAASVAWAGAVGVAVVHLFIGLGQFPIDLPRAIVTDARIPTHDGQMPTGALLYDAYLRNGLFFRSFRNPGFGMLERAQPEPRAWRRGLARLEESGAPETVIFLFGAGWDHSFHFHAQEAGATYVSRASSDPSSPFASETWLEHAGVRIMTIRRGTDGYAALSRYDVRPGDEVWVTGTREFPTPEDVAKLPAGLVLEPAESFDPWVRVYRIEAAPPEGAADG